MRDNTPTVHNPAGCYRKRTQAKPNNGRTTRMGVIDQPYQLIAGDHPVSSPGWKNQHVGWLHILKGNDIADP
ncbi:hypothetical protein SK1NUM_06860 [Arachnia rubra]|nr:hypothetical protein SK1NUM_06860 [Arachnia rubra]